MSGRRRRISEGVDGSGNEIRRFAQNEIERKLFQQPFKNIRQKDKMKVNLRMIRIREQVRGQGSRVLCHVK